jgi:TRAP-type C4-dicarboxylate transport system substrate-binding protein
VKKFTLFILTFFFLSLVLNGCQQLVAEEKPKEKHHNDNLNEVQSIETLDVRESVWNRLTEEHKNHIQGTWKDASVYQRVLRENMGSNLDKTFIGKEVYIIDYPSNDNPTLGGIVVYADIKSHQLIGYGHRD